MRRQPEYPAKLRLIRIIRNAQPASRGNFKGPHKLKPTDRPCHLPFKQQMPSLSQFAEQSLGLVQVESVEALGEPAIDWSEKVAGLVPLALIAP